MRTLEDELWVGEAEMRELRPLLEAAIADHFDDGFLRHRWEGDVLRLSGPGARGSLVCEAGSLKLEAVLRPPASWVHRVIRRKLDAALEDVAAKTAAAGSRGAG